MQAWWAIAGLAAGLVLMTLLIVTTRGTTQIGPVVDSAPVVAAQVSSSRPAEARRRRPAKGPRVRVVTVKLGSQRHPAQRDLLPPPPPDQPPFADDYVLVTDSEPSFDTSGWRVIRYEEEPDSIPDWVPSDAKQQSRYRARECKWGRKWADRDGDVTIWIDFKNLEFGELPQFAGAIARSVQLARSTGSMVQDQYPWPCNGELSDDFKDTCPLGLQTTTLAEMQRLTMQQSDVYGKAFSEDVAAMRALGGLPELLLPSPATPDTHIMVWVQGSPGDRLRRRVWESFPVFGHALRDQLVQPVVLRREPELSPALTIFSMHSSSQVPWPSRAELVPSACFRRGRPRPAPNSGAAVTDLKGFVVSQLASPSAGDCVECLQRMERESGPDYAWQRRVEIPSSSVPSDWLAVEIRSPRVLAVSGRGRVRVWTGHGALHLDASATTGGARMCTGPFPDTVLVQALDGPADLVWLTHQCERYPRGSPIRHPRATEMRPE